MRKPDRRRGTSPRKFSSWSVLVPLTTKPGAFLSTERNATEYLIVGIIPGSCGFAYYNAQIRGTKQVDRVVSGKQGFYFYYNE
jgi:hypothetical protein